MDVSQGASSLLAYGSGGSLLGGGAPPGLGALLPPPPSPTTRFSRSSRTRRYCKCIYFSFKNQNKQTLTKHIKAGSLICFIIFIISDSKVSARRVLLLRVRFPCLSLGCLNWGSAECSLQMCGGHCTDSSCKRHASWWAYQQKELKRADRAPRSRGKASVVSYKAS